MAIPNNIIELWDKQAIIQTFTSLVTISTTEGGKVGSKKFEDRGFGNRTVYGIALISANGDGSKGSSQLDPNGDATLQYSQVVKSFLELVDKNGTKLCEDLPLQTLMPPVGKSFVPIYLENFNPSKSSIKWVGDLANVATTKVQIVLYTL